MRRKLLIAVAAVVALIVVSVLVLLAAGARGGAGHNLATIEIAAPPSVVADHIFDLEKLRDWVGWRKVTREGDAPLAADSHFRVTTGSDDYVLDLDGEVTAFEPGKRLGLRLTSLKPDFVFSEDAVFTVEPAPAGSRLTMEAKATYGGTWRLFEPLITPSAQKRFEEHLAQLKAKLETK